MDNRRQIAERGWNKLASIAHKADPETWPTIEAVAHILFRQKVRLKPKQVKEALRDFGDGRGNYVIGIKSRVEELTGRLNMAIAENEEKP